MNNTFKIINVPVDDITMLEVPLHVTTFVCYGCSLRSIPVDFFMKFNNIESIELQKNNLTEISFEIPQTVTLIDLADNKLDRNAIMTYIPETIENIIVSGNPYHNFMALENARHVTYNSVVMTNNKVIEEENEKKKLDKERQREREIQIQEERDIIRRQRKIMRQYGDDDDDRINLNDKLIVNNKYNDADLNVHNYDMQNRIRGNITYLLKKPRNLNYIKEMIKTHEQIQPTKIKNIFDKIMCVFNNNDDDKDFEKMLIYYNNFTNNIIYDYENELTTTIPRLIEAIWSTAVIMNKKEDILASLYGQMIDGYKMCFVGKYTRVVNSLASFDNNIEIMGLTVQVLIQNKIEMLQKMRDVPTDKLCEELIDYMNKNEVSKEEQKPWIDAFKEYFE